MILGFLLAIAFDPFTFTGATSPRWALLAIALPIVCAFQSRKHLTFSHLLGGLFITWAAVSIAWTPNIWDGMNGLIQIIIIALCFVMGSRENSLKACFTGLSVGITISSAILLLHPILTFPSIVLTYPHGLFGNRNMLGEVAVLTALGCCVYHRYWFIPGLLPAMFWYPLSRGALWALAIGWGVILWPRWKWLMVGLVASVVAYTLVSVLVYDFHVVGVVQRIQVWEAVAHNISLVGHGLGSLFTLAPFFSGFLDTSINRLDHAHNDALEILFELGIPGLVIYVSIITHAIGCEAKNGSLGNTLPVLAAFLVISSVAFPWHVPVNAFIGALVLGHSIRNGRSLRSLYADGRAFIRQRTETRAIVPVYRG
jgi:hypothetical protein